MLAALLAACWLLGPSAAGGSGAMPDEELLLRLSELFDEGGEEEAEDGRELRSAEAGRPDAAAIDDPSDPYGGFLRQDFRSERAYQEWPHIIKSIRNSMEATREASQKVADAVMPVHASDIIARQTGMMPHFNAEALRHSRFFAGDAEEAKERLRESVPLMWLHIPKCGSSFANSIVHLPGVCPGLPRSVEISDRTFGAYHLRDADKRWHFINQACRGNLAKFGSHKGIPSQESWEDQWNHKGVTVVRQPESRIVSAYKNQQHSWPTPHKLAPNIIEYAHGIQGCVTRMLTQGGNSGGSMAGHWGGPCGGDLVSFPGRETVELAKARLRNFSFVGIQEYWPLSICLLHAKLGGPCYPQEFIDSRHVHRRARDPKYPAGFSSRELRAEMNPFGSMNHIVGSRSLDLKGFRDPYDNEVYESATQDFLEELRRYDVNEETCRPCFSQLNAH